MQTPLNQRTKSNFQEALRSGWQSSRTEAVEGSARASLQCRPTVLPSPGLAPTSEILVSTELVCRLPESTRRQSRGAQRLVHGTDTPDPENQRDCLREGLRSSWQSSRTRPGLLHLYPESAKRQSRGAQGLVCRADKGSTRLVCSADTPEHKAGLQRRHP